MVPRAKHTDTESRERKEYKNDRKCFLLKITPKCDAMWTSNEKEKEIQKRRQQIWFQKEGFENNFKHNFTS